jgi:type III pantothenate kinase
MSYNLLAINVGNTRCHLGAFVDGELINQAHLDVGADDAATARAVEHVTEPLKAAEKVIVLVGTVNNDASRKLEQRISRQTGWPVQHVERDVNVPIGRQLDADAVVGTDRLLNAAAAYDQIKQACIVVDAGTAVTVDFVDGDGTFHGGAILPGASMMLRSLHEHTAQLPDVPFDRPNDPIGHNTAQAMLDGVFHGLRGAVRELVEKYAEVYGAYPKVIATGGDAERLFKDYELIEAIVPDLALRGLGATCRRAMEDRS